MRFVLEMDCDNAAFDEETQGDVRTNYARYEIVRILEIAIHALKHGKTNGRCMDSNGNSVGTWEIEE